MKVCESFRSLQGEGKKIGAVTYFIRFVGCNLECAWCDTKYASETKGTDMTIDKIMELVGGDSDVCLTGGEPLLQEDMPELIRCLADAGKTVVIETNGSVDISCIPTYDNVIISMDIKCPSSKMQDRMNFKNLSVLRPKDQLKFIVSDGYDLEYALSVLDKYKPDTEIIFSPVGGMDIEPLAEEIIGRNLNVRVLPQLHKIIWGNKRGV